MAATEKAMVGPVRRASGEAPARQGMFAFAWTNGPIKEGATESCSHGHLLCPSPFDFERTSVPFLWIITDSDYSWCVCMFIALSSAAEQCRNARIAPEKRPHSRIPSLYAPKPYKATTCCPRPNSSQPAHTYHDNGICSAFSSRQPGA